MACVLERNDLRHCPKCNETFPKNGAGSRVRFRQCCTIEERFWMYGKKMESGCWLWQGCKDKQGYGQYGVHHKRHQAHRYAYTLSNGAVPHGMQVLHRCDTPACINPEHLFLGTNDDNMRDKALKGRAGTRLNLDQVREIKAALATGKRGISAELARKYQVSATLIYGIKVGKHYSYLP